MNGKHVFNPTNFGIVALMLADRRRPGSRPGQWGNVAFFAFLMACLGGLVVNRAARRDVTLAFLAFYSRSLVRARRSGSASRSPIPLHRLAERRACCSSPSS